MCYYSFILQIPKQHTYRMLTGIPVFIFVLLTLISNMGVIFSGASKDVYIHCMEMERNRLDSTPRTIIPVKTSEILQPVTGRGTLRLDLCPDRRFLKISWISNHTSDGDVGLCYRMKSALNESMMNTTCFRLHIYTSQHLSAFDCWFPMYVIDQGPLVTAWVQPFSTTLHGSFHGRLDTSSLGPGNTCKDFCEVTSMDIGSHINCHDKASIIFDSSTVVKHLSFDTVKQNLCENSAIHISRQTNTHLQYHLNCSFNGQGHIKVLYIANGKYCLKYQLVSVTCLSDNSTTMPLTSEPDNTHSFGIFVIFGFVCIIVISAVFFGIILVAQWVINKRHIQLKFHRDSVTDSRNLSISIEDSVHAPLTMDNYRRRESQQQRSPEKTKSADIPRKPSRRRRFSSTSLRKLPEMLQEKRTKPLTKLRRSVTIALLEDTDPFYKKRLVFLPVPFDHFTNEVTKLLKDVFSIEAGLFTQCCYDRSMHKYFMTSDRIKWIDTMLGDHDKILVFLCFKSLSSERTEGKTPTMVEEILDRLLLSKVESPRLCKVVFLYLTDSSENVRRKHYGDIFHVCDSDSFSNFVYDVMKFCGRSVDDYPELIEKVLLCKSSKHFLRYIGIKNKTSKIML